MAWRQLRKGVSVTQKVLELSALERGLISSRTCICRAPGFHAKATPEDAERMMVSAKLHTLRHFHGTNKLFARGGSDELIGLRGPRKEKHIKKANRTQAPVEAPYVPTAKRDAKTLPDRTIDIFEGMTVVELAKRSGHSVSSIEEILTNVGENVSSEFDAISIDVAELVAMVFVNIVHTGVGPISQSDVDMAQACGACIVAFNIRNPPSSVTLAANRSNIKIRQHRVIYHLLEDLGSLIVDKAPGVFETTVAGEAQVLSIFELKGRSKSKGADVKIAGCRITDGRFTKSSTMRLLRSGEVLFEGSCASLKREKQDVETVGKGNECGLVIKDYDDFQVGDIIQCLELVNKKPKFVSSQSGAVRIEC